MRIPKEREQSRMKNIEREPEATLVYRQRRCPRQGGGSFQQKVTPQPSLGQNNQPLYEEAQAPRISEVPIRLWERCYSGSWARFPRSLSGPGSGATLDPAQLKGPCCQGRPGELTWQGELANISIGFVEANEQSKVNTILGKLGPESVFCYFKRLRKCLRLKTGRPDEDGIAENRLLPLEQARIPCNLAAANYEPNRAEHAKGLSHFLAISECGRTCQQQKKEVIREG